MTTHSSILALEISGTGEPEGYSPWGHKRVGEDLGTEQQQQRKGRNQISLSPQDEETATRKWVLPRHQIPHILVLDLPAFRAVRNKYFLIATQSLLFVLATLTDKRSNKCLLRRKIRKDKKEKAQKDQHPWINSAITPFIPTTGLGSEQIFLHREQRELTQGWWDKSSQMAKVFRISPLGLLDFSNLSRTFFLFCLHQKPLWCSELPTTTELTVCPMLSTPPIPDWSLFYKMAEFYLKKNLPSVRKA